MPEPPPRAVYRPEYDGGKNEKAPVTMVASTRASRLRGCRGARASHCKISGRIFSGVNRRIGLSPRNKSPGDGLGGVARGKFDDAIRGTV